MPDLKKVAQVIESELTSQVQMPTKLDAVYQGIAKKLDEEGLLAKE